MTDFFLKGDLIINWEDGFSTREQKPSDQIAHTQTHASIVLYMVCYFDKKLFLFQLS